MTYGDVRNSYGNLLLTTDNLQLPVTSGGVPNNTIEKADNDNSLFYLICKPNYKYFRFIGRHFGFPVSGYVRQ